MGVRTAWTRLLSVRELAFEARSLATPDTGWNGRGEGVVLVEGAGAGAALFHEAGTWTPAVGRPTAFTNVFRWAVDPDGGLLRLEHLRIGPDRPVHLFDLVPAGEGVLASSRPHACRDDLYAARLEYGGQVVRLTWTIDGPRKAETISYTYRSGPRPESTWGEP